MKVGQKWSTQREKIRVRYINVQIKFGMCNVLYIEPCGGTELKSGRIW